MKTTKPLRTNRQVLREHGFTDEAEDSLRRAIIQRLKKTKGELLHSEALLLVSIGTHRLQQVHNV